MRFHHGVVATVLLGTIAVACGLGEGEGAPDLGPCVADTFEPNDSATSPWALGGIQDDDDAPSLTGGSKETAQPNLIRKSFTTHMSSDVDWFAVHVKDSGLGGNPQLSVIVSSAYEATAWFSCDNGKTESVICGLGDTVTDDTEFAGRGCVTKAGTGSGSSINVNLAIECADTSTDSGNLTIRVRRLAPSSACERYDLTVTAN